MKKLDYKSMARWAVYALVIGLPLLFSLQTHQVYFPIKLLLFRLVTVFMFFATAWQVSRGELRFNKLWIAFGLYIGAAFIASVFSPAPWTAFFSFYPTQTGFFNLLLYFGLAFWFIQGFEDDVWPLLGVIFWTAVAYAIISIPSFYFNPLNLALTATEHELSGPAGFANWAAALLAISLMAGYGLLLKEANSATKKRILLGAGLLLVWIALVLTGSRGGVLGALAGTGLFFSFRRISWRMLVATLITIIVFGVFSSGLFYSMKIAVKSGNVRSSYYAQTWSILKQHFWTGIGSDNYPIFYHRYKTINVRNDVASYELNRKYDLRPMYAHNEFIDVLIAYGVLGLAAYLFLLFVYFSFVWKAWVLADQNRQLMLLISLAGVLVHLIVQQFSFWSPSFYHLFWLFLFMPFLGQGSLSLVGSKLVGPARATLVVLSIIILIFSWKSFWANHLFQKAISSPNLKEKIYYAEAAIKNDPFVPEYQDVYFGFLVQDNQEEKARLVLENMLRLSPYNAHYIYNYSLLQKDAEKEIWLKRAVQAAPFFSVPQVALLKIYREKYINPLIAKKKNAEAIDYYQELVSFAPYFWEPYYSIGSIYLTQKEYGEAEKFLLKAISLDPDSIKPYRNLVILYLLNNRKDLAKKYYELGLKLKLTN